LSGIYLDEFKRVARTAFAMWNRDPASASFGSFDRQYWGWKYKDFSDSTLQCAVRLAIEYARLREQTSTLPRLIDGYVSYCGRIQLRDGSFDQCYPYERTPGVVFDILSTLIYVRQCPYLESDGEKTELDGIIEKAARFALHTDETHGAIANHYAEYAYELFHYAKYARNNEALTQANRYLDRVLALFERKEGWFEEYAGPDPGYQTRTLRYLAKIAELNERSDLWPVISKAAEFVGELMMPDGSLHPMLGSRSTALLYPSAFEILARREGRFRGLAAKVREAWDRRRVPLPSELDFCNAIRLADDARDAADASAPAPELTGVPPAVVGPVDYPKAGIAIRRSADRVVYVNWRLGGVVVVFSRARDQWELTYEDSGYLLKSTGDTDSWLTRMPDSGELLQCSREILQLQAAFRRSLHDEVTPSRLIILRLLNLTILRIQWVADWFRKIVVKRLMGNKVTAPVRLDRRIDISDNMVTITDSFSFGMAARGMLLDGALYRCRRVTGTHMASSRYFQEAELAALPSGWMEQVAAPVSTAGPFTTRIGSP